MINVKRKSRFSIFNLINWILFIGVVLLGALDFFVIFKYKILNFKYINYIAFGIWLFMCLILFIMNYKKRFKVFVFIFSIFMICSMFFAFNKINSAVNFFSKLNVSAKVNENSISVMVLKDSPVSDINGLGNTPVLAASEIDKDNIEKLVKDVKEKTGVDLNLEQSISYLKAYEDLISGKSKAMVLNSAYAGIIESVHQNFLQGLKSIYELKITREVKEVQKKYNTDNVKSFNIYVSGIDTYGAITNVSRSDVNVIVSVNMDTHKIVLTSVPRDSYVRIQGGGNNQYDKLTHSGIYGIDASVSTLEKLYDTNIDYYVRVNFSSFMKLIDLLGGIEVENTQAFKSTHGGFYFPKGKVMLTSEKALGFVRERYSLSDGDRDRGRNHEKVIAAIINKMSGREFLLNYQNILNELSNSIQTNMPLETVMELVNKQLGSGIKFSISSQDLKGVGKKGLPSYAMPGYDLYMMEVNQKSLEETKNNMKKVLEGK